MNQTEMELKFSKRMKDFIVVDDFLMDSGQLMSDLLHMVNPWREREFWPMKQGLVNQLPDSDIIVVELMITILLTHDHSPIQGPACQLGSRLGYKNIIDAAKIGSSIISEAAKYDLLLDLELDPDGTYVYPKLELSAEAMDKIKRMNYLPPNLCPMRWDEPVNDGINSNYGGWNFEKKSCILGSGNHHEEYQATDVLNRLQSIKWKLDTDVFVNESHEHMTHNEKEIVGHYIGESFFFTWRFDKRGRMYSSGYNINPQSDEYGKAMLSPANSEICTDEGIKALEIDVVNHIRVGDTTGDKLTWDERIDIFDYYATYGVFGSIYGDDSAWKNPILGRKTLRAWSEAIKGEPVSHFIELDATSSGCQLMACLSGCVQSASLCNLTNTGKRENLYQHVHDEIAKMCDISEDVQTKKAVMTHFYNSKAIPERTFNEDQLACFYNVLEDELPGCQSVMDILNECWNPNALEHSWELPDGHVCKVKVIEKTSMGIKIEELDDREFTLVYNKNMPSMNGRSLAANVIHSVDGWVCREMVRRCDFEVSCIHDCWQCHPNNAEQLKQVYREILSDLAGMNLLNDICSQITGTDMGIEIVDEGLAEMILESSYALS